MPQLINRKILLYFLLFIILGTFNNKNLNKFDFPKVNSIKINSQKTIDDNFIKSLELFKLSNIFFINELKLKKILESNNLIQEYKVFKRYPSILEIEIIETKFLAKTNKDAKIFFIGSNGKLIEIKKDIKNLPYIFGDFDINSFLDLKKIIDSSNLDFSDVKNLYSFPSGRWDVEISSGTLIKLPNEKIKESLDLSLNLLNSEKFNDIKLIDVRQKNQVIMNE